MYSLTERWRRLCSSELRVDYHIYIICLRSCLKVVWKLSMTSTTTILVTTTRRQTTPTWPWPPAMITIPTILPTKKSFINKLAFDKNIKREARSTLWYNYLYIIKFLSHRRLLIQQKKKKTKKIQRERLLLRCFCVLLKLFYRWRKGAPAHIVVRHLLMMENLLRVLAFLNDFFSISFCRTVSIEL